MYGFFNISDNIVIKCRDMWHIVSLLNIWKQIFNSKILLYGKFEVKYNNPLPNVSYLDKRFVSNFHINLPQISLKH